MIDRTLGLRDKNGVEIHDGDTVLIRYYDGRQGSGRVHYDKGVAAWMIGNVYIVNVGRDRGTELEVAKAREGIPPHTKRRKGKPS